MRGTCTIVAVVLLVGAGVAIAARPEVKTTHESAEVKLKEAGPFDKEGPVVVEFGDTVKMKAKLYVGEFFGKKVIYANATGKNTGKEPVHFQYYIAFFDKDMNLVAGMGQNGFDDEGLAPGETENLGSMIMPIPHAALEAITSYKITFYEGGKMVGKE